MFGLTRYAHIYVYMIYVYTHKRELYMCIYMYTCAQFEAFLASVAAAELT